MAFHPKIRLSAWLLLALWACQKADFSTQNQKPAPPPEPPPPAQEAPAEAGEATNTASEPIEETLPPNQIARTLHMTCQQGPGYQHSLRYPPGKDIALTLTGEICTPRPGETLTALFLIDASGSMNEPFVGQDGETYPANDPLKAGSCGRYRAVTSVLKKLRELITAEHQTIDARVIIFNAVTQEVAHIVVDYKSRNTTPRLSADAICQGALGTFFAPAFAKAQQQFAASMAGPKVLYFISDGVPSDSERSSALAAGKALRAAFNLSLFTVLLGSGKGTNKEIMTAIAGNQNLVKKASTADDLVSKIAAFDVAGFKKEDVSLTGTGLLAPKPLIVSLTTGGNPQRWQAQRFVVNTSTASQQPSGSHSLHLQAKDASGYQYTQEATVNLIEDATTP